MSAWYVASGGYGFEIEEENALKFMRKIQARAGRIIEGAFETTARSALDIELFLRPVNLQLDIFVSDAPLGLVSSPGYNYIKSFRGQASNPEYLNLTSKQIRSH